MGKPWKGLLASLILWGTGQFFSGARRRGLIWFAIGCGGPPCLLLLYTLPFVPGKAGVLLLGIGLLVWLAMLYDSYRPIKLLHWWGWVVLVTVSLALSGLSSATNHQLFRAFKIPTGSMEPTLRPGDEVLVARCAYWFHQPRRGDIVVFKTSSIPQIQKDPSGKEVIYDKRIVGIPADRVEILDPEIRVNGVEMKFGDPTHPVEYRHGIRYNPLRIGDKDSYIVPADTYFVLGDNSAHAFDSRYWGPVSRNAIYGKVTKIYWPWNRCSTPR